MVQQVDIIRKGDLITARQLNEYGDGINTINKKSVASPSQQDSQANLDVQIEAAEEEAEINTSNFVESSRTTIQVQIFDQNETNYALIDRIETITFVNGAGETLTLEFAN